MTNEQIVEAINSLKAEVKAGNYILELLLDCIRNGIVTYPGDA